MPTPTLTLSHTTTVSYEWKLPAAYAKELEGRKNGCLRYDAKEPWSYKTHDEMLFYYDGLGIHHTLEGTIYKGSEKMLGIEEEEEEEWCEEHERPKYKNGLLCGGCEEDKEAKASLKALEASMVARDGLNTYERCPPLGILPSGGGRPGAK